MVLIDYCKGSNIVDHFIQLDLQAYGLDKTVEILYQGQV